MNIIEIAGYGVCHRFLGGSFRSSYGVQHTLGNLLLKITTDTGIQGFGEVVRPPAFWNGNPMAPPFDRLPGILKQFIGQEFHALVSADTGAGFQGAFVPAGYEGTSPLCHALETAFFDGVGKASGQPVHGFLGGRKQVSVVYYISLTSDTPAAMGNLAASTAGGARVVQMKVAGTVETEAPKVASVLDRLSMDARLLVDGNGHWGIDDACVLISQFPDRRIWWEEPCATYEMNREVADRTGAPIVLDQCMKGLEAYAMACCDRFAAGVGIKPSLLGGLSKARVARDLCTACGISLKIDDSWSGDVNTAAVLHLSLGVPEAMLTATCCLRNQFEEGARFSGINELPGFRMEPSEFPGLGLSGWKDSSQPPLFLLR